MARIETPTHSDDDFDLLYDAGSVSDLSDAQGTLSSNMARGPSQAAKGHHVTGPERLSGPHEIPVMPHTTSQDDLTSITQQFSGHSIGEGASSSSHVQRSPSVVRDRGNLVSGGLQYTKSVYNKLWNKDALIAVMG